MVAPRTPTPLGRGAHADVRWLGPLPIWARPGPAGLRLGDSAAAARPAILRFDHDDFMQDYLDTLQTAPERLAEWQAQPETWRAPMATPARQVAGVASATLDSRVAGGVVAQVAHVVDHTHRQTTARKRRARRGLPGGIDLLPLKSRLRRALPQETALPLPLKLYQAGQKRHYLVCASLVHEAPGLPDCLPAVDRQERVGFVVRRLLPPADREQAPLAEWDEFAFVPGPQGNTWQRVAAHGSASARRLVSGEEELPLFPSAYRSACDEQRRLFSGSLPVSRREQWVGAELGGDAEAGVPAAAAPGLAAQLLNSDVVAPWKLLLEQASFQAASAAQRFTNFGSDASAEARDRQRLLRTARDQLQTGSWYVLLDLARFLRERLPQVWAVLRGEGDVGQLPDAAQALVAALRGATLDAALAEAIVTYHYFVVYPFGQPRPTADTRYDYGHLRWNLADALLAAEAAGADLEAVEGDFVRFDESGAPLPLDPRWPDFLFPLADPEQAPPLPAVDAETLTGLTGLARQQAAVDALAAMIVDLLPAATEDEGLLETVPLGDAREAWFVLRCVYQRPGCGPLFPPLVSEATQRFQMASFFDPDAPARPVRIPMPLDISPAGLRKYQKNTGFVISDMLCGKLKGIRKMTLGDLVLSVLPWPFHKDLPDPGKAGPCKDDGGNGLGMMCSLSIPIVTLCAMILMMIMVALFDVIFRWIPYLFVCLPIPGLRGKKGGG